VKNYIHIEDVEIFDVYGRKMSQIPNATLLSSASGGNFTSHSSTLINISHLPAGFYFVKIKTDITLIYYPSYPKTIWSLFLLKNLNSTIA
jgi:hypothetical protein